MVRWNDISEDPNDRDVLRARQHQIDLAQHPQIEDRTAFVTDRCRGKRVLDIGCVQHRPEAENSDGWLHRRIVDVADVCVGTDVLSEAVAILQKRGYDIVDHDLLEGPGPLTNRGPFDVIVCGELIEHLDDPQRLLTVCGALLAPGGEVIITTPNPYAPIRGSAGARLTQWENADHVTYLFPSGMALMAARAQLKLSIVATVQTPKRLGQLAASLRLAGPIADVLERLGPPGRAQARRFRSLSRRMPVPLGVFLSNWSIWDTGMLGETAIYVLELDRTIDLAALALREDEYVPHHAR